MVLNFTTIGNNGGKDFDSKPAKTPDSIHRSETWLKKSAQMAYLNIFGLDRISIQNDGL